MCIYTDGRKLWLTRAYRHYDLQSPQFGGHKDGVIGLRRGGQNYLFLFSRIEYRSPHCSWCTLSFERGIDIDDTQVHNK